MLVDTSVWVDHLRRPEPGLIELLEVNEVDVHPFVIGELACGHLRGRDELIRLLQELPLVPIVAHEETLAFLEQHRLHGRGVRWVDVHLLASVLLASTTVWTRDRHMAIVARELGVESARR